MTSRLLSNIYNEIISHVTANLASYTNLDSFKIVNNFTAYILHVIKQIAQYYGRIRVFKNKDYTHHITTCSCKRMFTNDAETFSQNKNICKRKPKWCICKEPFGVQGVIGSLNIESKSDRDVSLPLTSSPNEFSRRCEFADSVSMATGL